MFTTRTPTLAFRSRATIVIRRPNHDVGNEPSYAGATFCPVSTSCRSVWASRSAHGPSPVGAPAIARIAEYSRSSPAPTAVPKNAPVSPSATARVSRPSMLYGIASEIVTAATGPPLPASESFHRPSQPDCAELGPAQPSCQMRIDSKWLRL